MGSLNFTNSVALTVFYPLAVGTIFTFLSIWLSGRNAARNAARQNDLSAKLKLADFRQAWINDLRQSLADFQSRALISDHTKEELHELYRLSLHIMLLMNNRDRNYEGLTNLLDLLLKNRNSDAINKLVRELIPLSQDILKTEWGVLKTDLRYDSPLTKN